MTETTRGLAALLLAAVIWGVLGLYYHALAHVPALEVLAHRVVWSAAFFALLLAGSGRLGAIVAALRDHGAAILAAAITVSINWLVYIVAIQTGHALDSSLGYYMLPLAAVALGVAFYRERLRPVQWLAVGLAFTAVTILTIGLGAAPWTSLAIAVSFALYGAVKKGLSLDPIVSVGAEVALLLPIAAVFLLWPRGAVEVPGAHFGSDAMTTVLLILTGPVTAAPLILFSYGSRRLPMTTAGLVMYVNPTMQLAVAVFAFGEPFTRWHAAAFVLIWTALAIYAADGLRRARRAPA